MRMSVAEFAQCLRLDRHQALKATRKRSLYSLIAADELAPSLVAARQLLEGRAKCWDPTLLNQFKEPWAAALRKLYATPVAYPASLPPSQGLQLRNLVLDRNVRSCVEIGCFIGVSSLWIGSAIRENGDGYLRSVDLFEPKAPNRFHFSFLDDPYEAAAKAVRDAGLHGIIEFVRSESTTYAAQLDAAEPLDMVFIDGDHTFLGIARDFLAYFPLLRKGGVAVLHDIHPAYCGWTGPRKFLDRYLSACPNVRVTEIETQPNFGIAVVEKTGDELLPLSWPRLLCLQAEVAAAALARRATDSAPARMLRSNVVLPLKAFLRRSHK